MRRSTKTLVLVASMAGLFQTAALGQESWELLSDFSLTVEVAEVIPNGVMYTDGWVTTVGDRSAVFMAPWGGTVWHSLGAGVENTIYEMGFDARGRLWLVGDFPGGL